MIIGIVMGLTGAGGALVAIPLFIQFLHMPLKLASVYSLLAVVIASLSNFLTQRKATNYKIATIIVISSAIGSYISTPFKAAMSDTTIMALLICISLYALYAVWAKKGKADQLALNPKLLVMLSIPIGLILGALTTFTGLGGGVLMLPVFIKIYRFGQAQAVATSLLAVGLSSLASLAIQIKNGFHVSFDAQLMLLIIGILIAAMGIKYLTKKLSVQTFDLSRKIVFTIVVLLAIAKIMN
jgi:uncharacterized membrane protein YfcA